MGEEKPASSMMIFAAITVGALAVLSLLVLFSMNGMNGKLTKLDSDVASLSGAVQTLGAQGPLNGTPVKPAEPAQPGQTAPIFNLTGKTPRGTGTVTIVEFSDFQCPYCSRAEETMKQVMQQYGSKVKVYFKQFPLPPTMHPNAQKAAEASECASDQGKFWDYHDMLFANQKALDIASLKKYAGELALDQGKFDTCLDTGAKASAVSADAQEGAKNGVQGTPTFFINNKPLVGAQPLSSFQAAIDAELK